LKSIVSHISRRRSNSMRAMDHKPLDDTPAAKRIRAWANNRLGAVYSALYSFWSARDVAVNAGNKTARTRRVGGASTASVSARPGIVPATRRTVSIRRDAYSAVLFNKKTKEVLVNDSTSSSDELLSKFLSEGASGGTDFSAALRAAKAVMVQNWSAERLVIFSCFSVQILC
jgi:Mg-chelatase subunit ChlD